MEIKFRGKRVDNGEWVYGSGVIIVGKDYSAIPATKDVTKEDYAITLIKVIPESVGQYVGIEDKNGVEIYTGDIVYDTPQHLIVMFGKTKGINGFALFEYLTDENGVCGITDLCCVIGNLTENPQLLSIN